jgi:hypothetical protein
MNRKAEARDVFGCSSCLSYGLVVNFRIGKPDLLADIRGDSELTIILMLVFDQLFS